MRINARKLLVILGALGLSVLTPQASLSTPATGTPVSPDGTVEADLCHAPTAENPAPQLFVGCGGFLE